MRRPKAKYTGLRRQHDMLIVRTAMNNGVRMSPERWSRALYGDDEHKSEMQSVIDRVQNEVDASKLVERFFEKLAQLPLVYRSLFEPLRDDFHLVFKHNFDKKTTSKYSQSSDGN